MKKKSHRIDWSRVIRGNDVRELRKMNARLYKDMDESILFLRSLSTCFFKGVVQYSSPEQRDALISARIKFRALPDDEKERVVNRLGHPSNPSMAELIVLIMGTFKREVQESFATFDFLTRLMNKQRRYIDHVEINSAMHCLLVLIEASAQGRTSIWANTIRQMHERKDARILKSIIEQLSTGQSVMIDVIPMTSWPAGQHCCVKIDGDVHFRIRIPAPSELALWVRRNIDRIIEEINQRDEGLTRLAHNLQQRIKEYGAQYEHMWLEMILEPKWGLRHDWLDAITIDIPELAQSGYRSVRLMPSEPFPNFQARFERINASGDYLFVQINLEPSDLIMVQKAETPKELDILNWVDRILAFIALRTAWTIIMGELQKKESNHGTHEVIQARGAIVRPRFRRLPEGFKATPEARMRALEKFRKEPLPGFTFVREHQRGPISNSGEPLFTITDIAIVT